MNVDDLRGYIRDVPDFPKPGVLFKDITPLLANGDALWYTIDLLRKQYRSTDFDLVAACESRGFLFAAPLAVSLGRGMTILRKPGKLPFTTHKYEYDLEYGKAEMQMHVDSVPAGSRVWLVDDVLATGGTMEAGCKLIEKAQGKVVGCAFVMELEFLKGRDKLQGYDIFSLLKY